MSEYRYWGPILPLQGDPISVGCVATETTHREDGSTWVSPLNPILILEYDQETDMMRFVSLPLEHAGVYTGKCHGSGWKRVFTRVLRDMDYSDYYDGRRGGAFPDDDEDED